MNNVTVKPLIACILLATSCSIPAQSVVALRLDTLNLGGDEFGFSTTYMFDVPDTPGLLVVFGNNYGQPDRCSLLDEHDSLLFRSPYIGMSTGDCDDCLEGPIRIVDTAMYFEAMHDCYYEYGVASADESGAWSLVWNTTGMNSLSLVMRMWQDGSSWQLYPTWIPLPNVSYDCDAVIVSDATGLMHYYDNSVVHTVAHDCVSYDWHIVRSSGINPCDTTHITQVYLPNVFAPESGGENARWSPQWLAGESMDGYRWYVYSRQGALVASGYSGDSWDGTVRGQRAPEGVYVGCVISGGGQYVVRGGITLLR